MSRKHLLAIIASLVVGTLVCAGGLALTMGTSSAMFWPAISGCIVVLTVITIITQTPKKGK